VPETSRISALQCAIRLGISYEEGLTKNRYIARTFIMPGQKKRRNNVRKKLNPVRSVFEVCAYAHAYFHVINAY
jgi:amidophosphoribosyltransferase